MMNNNKIKTSNENLLNSVLAELKHRIKAPPSDEIAEEEDALQVNCNSRANSTSTPKHGSKKPVKPTDNAVRCNGIAEYNIYCRSVGSSPKSRIRNRTLPVKTRNLSSSKPPTKPIRRNKPLDSKPVLTKSNQSLTSVENSSISNELHQFIMSAFASPNHMKSKYRNNSESSLLRSDVGKENFYSSSSTLKNDDFGHKRSLGSIDSGLEGSAKSTRHIDEIIDDCFFGVEELSKDNCETPSKSHVYTSITSANSDEGNHSNPSVEDERTEEDASAADGISVYSFASADDIEESKLNVKLLKAKDKAKQLKKQASARKEQVGAFLDAAASNASVRLKKKLRRPSLKFTQGKGNKLQKLANK